MRKKTFAVLLAVALTFGVTVGATLAWLMDTTDTVTNTFTVGNIEIKLDESLLVKSDETYTLNENERVQGNQYQLIPGTTYPKDPVVTITEANVDCYLFVKFSENGASTYLTYTSALTGNGWIKLDSVVDGEDGDVWYREVAAEETNKTWELLVPETVEVKENIVLKTESGSNDILMPSVNQLLVWNAYAVQKDNLSVAEAWDLVDPTE